MSAARAAIATHGAALAVLALSATARAQESEWAPIEVTVSEGEQPAPERAEDDDTDDAQAKAKRSERRGAKQTDRARRQQQREEVEVVVTGTRTAEDSQRATVRTSVVTREEARRRGATNVGEALSGELGVQVNPSAYGDIGNPSAIQIQGFDRDRVLVLEDGERIIGDVGGAIDLASLPLSDVSRIEYVTGPTSSLYGTAAIGGVVNIITEPPSFPGTSAYGRLEGRSRRGLYSDGRVAHRAGDDWLAVDGSFFRSDGIALRDDRPDLALPDQRRWSLGVRGGSEPVDGMRLVLKGRYLRNEQVGISSEQLPGLGRFVTELPSTTDRFALHALQRIDLGGGSGVTVSAARQWADGVSRKDRRDSPVDESRFRSQRLTSYEVTGVIADGARTWVVGTRYEIETFAQRLEKTEVIAGSLAQTDREELTPAQLSSIAGYAQLGWKLDRTLTVMPGVRSEHHPKFGSVVAPRLAASYLPSRQLAFRASAGRGFRRPSGKELGFVFDHSFLGYIVTGNPDLNPEKSWGANAEVNYRPTRGLRLHAGVFGNIVHDLIDLRFVDQAPSGVQEFGYVNVGRARTFGGEASVATRLGSHFRSEVGYAYLFARNDEAGAPIASRPAHTIRTRLSAELPARFQLDVVTKSVWSAYVAPGIETPGFTTVDLRLARRFSRQLEGYAGATNVLGAQRDPSRLGDQRPLAGRTLYLGVAADLPEKI